MLKNNAGGTLNDWFVAPVLLPHGATVVKVTCWWTDNSSENGSLYLRRFTFSTGADVDMATLESRWNDSDRNLNYDDTISYAEIDNYLFQYILRLTIPPDGDIEFHGARIEYTTTQPH